MDGAGAIEKRQSQTREQLRDLQRELERLHNAIKGLKESLNPILNISKTSESSPIPPEQTLCSLATELRESVKSLQEAIGLIFNIKENIEL